MYVPNIRLPALTMHIVILENNNKTSFDHVAKHSSKHPRCDTAFATVLISKLPEQKLPPLALWCPRNTLMYIKKGFEKAAKMKNESFPINYLPL